MSNPYKKLGGQAIIYGLGNIVPRLLNYAVLTVYYTRRFPPEKYGIITELYAYVAILLVILTYGMETGLFRFSNATYDKKTVYSSILGSVFFTSCIFGAVVVFLRQQIASLIGYSGNPDYIVYLGLTLSMDAVCSIIFAKLRVENKVRRFAFIKILNVLTTVFFVFLFLEILPAISFFRHREWYITYFKDIEIGYIFIANLIASFIVFFILLTDLKGIKLKVDMRLLQKILVYSLPLLISGLAGIFNETIDRILLRKFSADPDTALYQLGIYGANYRIAVLLTIFVQMFRYAAEPFFFNLSGSKDSRQVYANVLKYFTVFLMILFLGISLGIDFFKLFIDSDYYEGLRIVPVVLLANVAVGILFNVNMWYKLSGHTMYGVVITGIGALLTIFLNIMLIPVYGYVACAWIHLISNMIMIALTYYYGQKIFRVEYETGKIALYIGVALILYFIGLFIRTPYLWINLLTCATIVGIYFIFCNKKENLIAIFLHKK